jgi:sugar phosphate permease
LTADRFGRERAGMVFGWIFTGHQIGAAIAALAAGIVRTDFLTYLPAFFAAGALCIVAALLILSVPRPAARRITAATPLPARG